MKLVFDVYTLFSQVLWLMEESGARLGFFNPLPPVGDSCFQKYNDALLH